MFPDILRLLLNSIIIGMYLCMYMPIMLQGYLHLAKSRYSMGAGSVSKLQYDATMTPDSLVDVVNNSDHSE